MNVTYFIFHLLHSLRAIYGTDGTKNALHGSESVVSAEREIHFFFDNSKLYFPFLLYVAKDLYTDIRYFLSMLFLHARHGFIAYSYAW